MQEEITSIQDYVAIIKRRKWSLVIPALIVFAIAAVAAFVWPPTYRSTSTILIEEQEIPRDFVASTVTGFADQRLQVINQRVMISTKLLEIVNRFNLYPDLRRTKTTEEVIDKMKKDIAFKTISADVMDSRTGRPSAATIAFSLSYDGENPELVQKVAGVLTSLYLEENLKVREQQTAGTFKFLEEEAQNVKDHLLKIEADLSAFKRKNMDALPELLQVNLQALDRTDRDISQLTDMLRSLREKESDLQSQLSSIPSETDNQDKALLRELKAKLVQIESRYSDKYPDVIKTKAEIAKLEERLEASSSGKTAQEKPNNPAFLALTSQLASIKANAESIRRQIDDLRRKQAEYQRRIEATPKVDEVYKGLVSERNNTQAKYDDLIRKTMEAKVAQGLEKGQMGERFNLIDPARLPEKPVKPNIPAVLLIGFVLGIGAGVGVAAIKEFSDRSVRSITALTKNMGLPVLGGIPEIVTWRDRKRQRIKRVVVICCVLAAIAAGIAVFHFFVMDLDVLWAKIARRLDL
jgi:polysaccharide chain length determinant protein (PEP-CTERM system associated)